MERDIIVSELRKIINSRGGMLPISDLQKYDADFVNKYEDDGSLAYEKVKVDVLEQIAQFLFNGKTAAQLKLVPDHILNKVMDELRKKEQVAINNKIKQLRMKEDIYDKFETDRKKKKKLESIKALNTVELDNEYDLLYPDRADELKGIKFEQGKEPKPRPRKLLGIDDKDGNKLKAIPYSGKGLSGGKRRNRISNEERARRSRRMKELHAKGKL